MSHTDCVAAITVSLFPQLPEQHLFDLQVVTPTSDGISVDVQYERSDAQLDKWGEKHGVPDVIVATGFIAKNPQGQVWHALLRSLAQLAAWRLPLLTWLLPRAQCFCHEELLAEQRPEDLVMQCLQSCSDVDQLRPLDPMQLTSWGDAATCYLQVTPLLTAAAAAV